MNFLSATKLVKSSLSNSFQTPSLKSGGSSPPTNPKPYINLISFLLMVSTFKFITSPKIFHLFVINSLIWPTPKINVESVLATILLNSIPYSIYVNVPVPSSTCIWTAAGNGSRKALKPCKKPFMPFMYFTTASAISARNPGKRKLDITKKNTFSLILNPNSINKIIQSLVLN